MRSTITDQKHNITVLMEQLQYHEIKAVHVSFSGSNDSGDVTIARLEALTPKEEIPEGLLDLVRVPKAKMPEVFEFGIDGKARVRDWKTNPPSLRELLVDVCYEELEARHGGWEINAGSVGNIILTPLAHYYKTQQIVFHIEYGYADSSYDYEDEEYNDE